MNLRQLLPLLFGIAIAAGCGGGGGGGTPGASGTLRLFATDSPREDYGKIWITVHKVELMSPTGVTTVFDDPQGRLLDVRTLRDASGERFVFLGTKAIPLQPYTSARVTVAKSLSLVATGSSTTEQKSFDDSFDVSPGKCAMTFSLTNGAQLGGAVGQLVVDFDLSMWSVVGGVVTPVAKHGLGNGLDDGLRHEDEDYHGVIAGLTGAAPNQTFSVTIAGGSAFRVQTSASTLIFNNNGTPSPALANGQFVEFRGTFSTTANAVIANSIKIEDGLPGQGEPEIKGAFSNVNAIAGTFTVEASEVENFVPTHTPVNVVVTGSTIFRNDRGIAISKDAFFALMQGGTATFVEAEGAYAAGTNTLTASKIKIEDDLSGGGGENNAEVNGVVSLLNPGTGTFSIQLGSWSGFSGAIGMIVPVQTTGSTTYRDDNGNNISAAAFFAALSNGSLAEAEGHFSGNVLIATKAKLDND